MFTVNRNPTPSDLKKFGWAMLFGFSVLGVLIYAASWNAAAGGGRWTWTASTGQIAGVSLLTLGILLCVSGTVAPGVTRPIYVVWMSVTVPIGIVMSMFLLTVLFVLLLPIFSLIVRMGDPLRKKLDSGESYWEPYKPHGTTIERMQRPF